MITKQQPKSVTYVPEHLLPMSPVCTLPSREGEKKTLPLDGEGKRERVNKTNSKCKEQNAKLQSKIQN
jgi:hypothetical protein